MLLFRETMKKQKKGINDLLNKNISLDDTTTYKQKLDVERVVLQRSKDEIDDELDPVPNEVRKNKSRSKQLGKEINKLVKKIYELDELLRKQEEHNQQQQQVQNGVNNVPPPPSNWGSDVHYREEGEKLFRKSEDKDIKGTAAMAFWLGFLESDAEYIGKMDDKTDDFLSGTSYGDIRPSIVWALPFSLITLAASCLIPIPIVGSMIGTWCAKNIIWNIRNFKIWNWQPFGREFNGQSHHFNTNHIDGNYGGKEDTRIKIAAAYIKTAYELGAKVSELLGKDADGNDLAAGNKPYLQDVIRDLSKALLGNKPCSSPTILIDSLKKAIKQLKKQERNHGNTAENRAKLKDYEYKLKILETHTEALRLLGKGLHPLQDVTAHSNGLMRHFLSGIDYCHDFFPKKIFFGLINNPFLPNRADDTKYVDGAADGWVLNVQANVAGNLANKQMKYNTFYLNGIAKDEGNKKVVEFSYKKNKWLVFSEKKTLSFVLDDLPEDVRRLINVGGDGKVTIPGENKEAVRKFLSSQKSISPESNIDYEKQQGYSQRLSDAKTMTYNVLNEYFKRSNYSVESARRGDGGVVQQHDNAGGQDVKQILASRNTALEKEGKGESPEKNKDHYTTGFRIYDDFKDAMGANTKHYNGEKELDQEFQAKWYKV